MTMTKNDFLAPVPPSGPFPVPGLGDVYIKQVPFGAASKMFTGAAAEGGTRTEMMVDLVVQTVCNQDGSPIFSAEDRESLASAPVGRVRPLIDLVVEHAGVNSDDVDEVLGN